MPAPAIFPHFATHRSTIYASLFFLAYCTVQILILYQRSSFDTQQWFKALASFSLKSHERAAISTLTRADSWSYGTRPRTYSPSDLQKRLLGRSRLLLVRGVSSRMATILQSSLPVHCQPTSGFLLEFSARLHTCVPTPLAFVSNTLGILSITAWLFSQVPQVYKNWQMSSANGISFYFLVLWLLGDVSNLIGAGLTHQASWQVALGSYYVFADICLTCQWMWYEKLQRYRQRWLAHRRRPWSFVSGDMDDIVIQGVPWSPSLSAPDADDATTAFKSDCNESSQIVARHTDIDTSNAHERRMSPPTLHMSPRVGLLLSNLTAIAKSSPLPNPRHPHQPVNLSAARWNRTGTIFAWVSTLFYMSSRPSQIYRNWKRQSVEGLSGKLFGAAFCGNLFYSLAIVTNPSAHSSFGPYGGGGWAGPDGSDRSVWIITALPFFLGAAGALIMDACVGLQFWLYDDRNVGIETTTQTSDLIPSVSVLRQHLRRDALDDHERGHKDDYGTF